MRRGSLSLTAVLVAGLFSGQSAHGAPPDGSEYAIKAAFLFHFAQLTDWPPAAFQRPTDPINFCIVGKDSVEGEMASVLNGRTIQTHSIRVLKIKLPSETQPCQVLFIGADESPRLGTLLRVLQNSPVLTVGEGESFAEDGGMIGFRLEDERLQFEINLPAAEKCNLKIGSKLLMLAKKVLPGSKKIH